MLNTELPTLKPPGEIYRAQNINGVKSGVMSSHRKRLLALAMFGAMLLFVIQAYTATNHSDPHDPYYAGDYAVENPKPTEGIAVLSYNIWFAQDIDQA